MCIFVVYRYLYWVDRSENGVKIIEIVGMDGSDRKMLVVVIIEGFLGLIFDYVIGRFYWISGYKEVL